MADERKSENAGTRASLDLIEIGARAMAENAGFRWEACAQSQWMGDFRAGLRAIAADVVEVTAARIAQARDAALEEAARECERRMISVGLSENAVRTAAAAIRKLKSSP